MKRLFVLTFLTAAVLLSPGCSRETTVAPPVPSADTGVEATARDALLAATELIRAAGWQPDSALEVETGGNPAMLKSPRGEGWGPTVDFQRETLPGGLAHYSARVRTGPGEYDFIGIHRVVRERSPCRPIRTRDTVFLQHGASKDFAGMFLPATYSEHLPDDFGFAVFLAQQDIDVWGIDSVWNMVPAEVNEFSFMADWGIPRMARDLQFGIEIARQARKLTGNGYDQMLLLGYSFGAEFGYAVMDADAQLPPGRRQVRGFIPVDMVVKADNEEIRQFMCDYGVYVRDRYASGLYNDDSIMRPVGELARDDPDADSPLFPGMTNLQVALYLGAAVIYPPTVHFMAGVMQDDFPVELQNVSIPAWIDFLCSASPHEPAMAGVDQAAQICDDAVPWDDHLGLVTAPILYVGASGGMGDLGLYTLTFLGSDDIQTLMVSTNPDILLDFGHIDIFLGNNAPELVWHPVLEWILEHGPNGNGPDRDFASAGPQ